MNSVSPTDKSTTLLSEIFQINSSISLLRGKIYDAMDNRPLATSSYKEALKLDVYCFEAFDLLTSHHMLTAQEGEADLCRLCALIFYFSADTFIFTISETCIPANYLQYVFHFTTEKDFLDSLPLSQQCTAEEEELLHFLFENKLKKVGELCIESSKYYLLHLSFNWSIWTVLFYHC